MGIVLVANMVVREPQDSVDNYIWVESSAEERAELLKNAEDHLRDLLRGETRGDADIAVTVSVEEA
ncbi:hypothetical protein [Paenibacillus naphthalenovorans]|uniref:hypothetical protein n=1 Tax=Paenibacillus naphthalenovorans TaxID=162209 RepID=UPI003D271AAD